MNTERASSSSSSTHRLTYEVFLSFRGEDTRNGFTSHLYNALDQKGICTFIDDEKLERGKSISPTLMKAIKESRFAIVILSKNYASSTWCLEELEEIIGCITKTGMIVLPIFYNVDPSDVRKQIGTFKQAFDEHEQRFKENTEKVQKWRAILEEVANTSGWHLPKRSEAECIQDIVEVIFNKLDNTFSAHTFPELIGMESRVEKLKSHLAMESNDVRIIGIWGTGGMGKTTLARVVYNMISSKFEACSFIANIREESEKCGLHKIQQILLRELLNHRDLEVHNVHSGVHIIKRRLRNKKIILVLDDVNELDQWKMLAGEHCWFGSGSRVIITTRDMDLLKTREVDTIYEAEVLNHDEALKLFSLKALKMDDPPEDYGKLSQDFVDYCKGLPLALEVLGSFLFNKSIDEWKSELNRLMTEFCDRGKIFNVLQISFNGLQPNEKYIFLNIACFFNHNDQNDVEKILDYLGLHAKIGLRVLIDKALIKLHKNQLGMHDLLQNMGRHIVCQECQDPAERSRLWSFEEINNVLTENTGTKEIQGIVLELHGPKNVKWNPEAFSKMRNLKLLKICGVQLMHGLKHLPSSLRVLDWREYPSKSLTSSFLSKCFEKLKFIALKFTEGPDISNVPNLRSLVLQNCINLRRINPSMGIHEKLTILDLRGCENLTNLPSKFEMECLEELNLTGCSKLTEIPGFGRNMKRVRNLYLGSTAITTLPTSIEHLTDLHVLDLKYCKNLTSLPSKFEIECLTELNLTGCSKLTEIPGFGRNMKRVHNLYLGYTAITTLPTSIEHLTDLVDLSVNSCKNLVHLPDTIFNLNLVRKVCLQYCPKLDSLPENLGNAESIEELDLSNTAIRKVPSSIGLLKNLKQLFIYGCKGLSSNSMPTSPHPIDLLFSSLSLSPASSLTSLLLNHCNLKAISNDIGSLVSLEWLDLSGNDFVCLPESIIRLSKLKWMHLNNCTSLQSLPKLPLNVELVEAEGCISLEMLPDPLKQSDSLEPSLYLHNCSKLTVNQSCIDRFISGIKKSLKLSPSLPLSVLKKEYNILIPGSEIPEWFRPQRTGNEVKIELPSHLCKNVGIAMCFVSCTYDILSYSLIANGKEISIGYHESIDYVSSDHLWLVYATPQFFDEESNKLLWEGDVNGFSQIRIKIESDFDVKKWGFHLIYKVKRSRDDCNGAGPSGEGSFNDIPNPKRIKRHTEARGKSDCEESSEYKDYDEELSDWDESNDSNPDA